jgi:hypothetical protein
MVEDEDLFHGVLRSSDCGCKLSTSNLVLCHEDDSASTHAGSDEERSTSSDSSASVDRSPDVVVSLPSLVPSIVVAPHMDDGAFSVTLGGINGKIIVAEGIPVVSVSTTRLVSPLLA